MKNQHSEKKFRELVEKMAPIQETKEGTIKGGFQTVARQSSEVAAVFNGLGCTCKNEVQKK